MKDNQIRLRVDSETKTTLKRKAKEIGLSVSEYLIRCGMRRDLPKKLNESEKEGVQLLKLNKLNYTRISNFIKSRDMLALSMELQELIKKSEKALNKILNG